MFVGQQQQQVVGLLDLGTSKISCLIVQRPKYASNQGWRVIGHSHIQSSGIRAGMLVDLDQAELAVRQAIGTAEDQAELTLDDVLVGVSIMYRRPGSRWAYKAGASTAIFMLLQPMR